MQNLLSNNEYFNTFPNKILGETYRTTNQHYQWITLVKGSIENVTNGINTPPVKRFEHFKKPIKLDIQSRKIKESLAKTKAQNTAKVNNGGKCLDGMQCLGDSIKQYNPNLSDLEIKIFVTYQTDKGIYDKATIQSNDWKKYYIESSNFLKKNIGEYVAFDGRNYVPSSLYYSGNIYKKIEVLKEKQEGIIKEVGEKQYNHQIDILESHKPTRLVITDGVENKLILLPFDKIFIGFNIKGLSDGKNYYSQENIISAFKNYYFDKLPEEEFKDDNLVTSKSDLKKYWLRGDNFPNGTDDAEKANRKRAMQTIGLKLFDKFLFEALTREDRLRIEHLWNIKHNNFKDVDYSKIPVGFSINRTFKGGEFQIRDAQREGIGFNNVKGAGIVAFDVGVGKTATAIVTLDDGIKKGLFKRPLIVVPNSTYEKWKGEIGGVFAKKDIKKNSKVTYKKGDLLAEGILPNYTINDYYNLGVKHIGKATDANGMTLEVDEYSITIVTFEGLMKFGFTEETQAELVSHIAPILAQGGKGRQAAKEREIAEETVEAGLDGAEVFIEDMGIDAIMVDEAHNFKNLFRSVKGDIIDKNGKREKKRFEIGNGGKPTGRALKLFTLNSYIHRKYNNKNTFGLTATPFTNSPLEVFSMLSLFAHHGLKDFGLYNIADFFSQFVDETYEFVWTVEGEFKVRAVIRGFRNLPTLQAIIYNYINYKTGEEANIQRPVKITLPLRNDESGIILPHEYQVPTEIAPTEEQKMWFEEIATFAKGENGIISSQFPVAKEGRALVAISFARAATISPFLLPFLEHEPSEITKEEFINSSPKLQYVMKCIATVKSYHEKRNEDVSGQVIYMSRGVHYFKHIKEYLVDYLKYKPSEVEMLDGKTSSKKKESIKTKFLSGEVKIIIGSETIKEGIDLQKRATNLYYINIDWNPTDLHQVSGRIHRFGNIYSHVRINLPLIENSFDIFAFQKLSEKTDRINDIWSRTTRSTVLKIESLNPEELKRGLISDPIELAKWEVNAVLSDVMLNLDLAEKNLQRLIDAREEISQVNLLELQLRAIAQEATEESAYQDSTKVDMKVVYRTVKAYAKKHKGNEGYLYPRQVDEHIKKHKKIERLERDILQKHNLDLFGDFQPIINKIQIDIKGYEDQAIILKSEDHQKQILERIEEEQALRQQTTSTVDERVRAFDRLNFLLECSSVPINRGNVCNIYGIDRGDGLEEIEIPKTVDLLEIEAPYKMSKKLKLFMPKNQQFVVSKWNDSLKRGTIAPIDKMINTIPKLRAQDGKGKEKSLVYARFFNSTGVEWFIIEWGEGKDMDTMFGYSILNGDSQMSEFGYLYLSEIESLNKSLTGVNKLKAMELDFHWTPKYLAEALYESDSDYFPEPKIRLAKENSDNINILINSQKNEAISKTDSKTEGSKKNEAMTKEASRKGNDSKISKAFIDYLNKVDDYLLNNYGFYSDDNTKYFEDEIYTGIIADSQDDGLSPIEAALMFAGNNNLIKINSKKEVLEKENRMRIAKAKAMAQKQRIRILELETKLKTA